MVLVTSSMAEAVCRLTLAESSEAPGHLAGSAGHLGSRVAHVAHQISQAIHHAHESVAQRVILGAGRYFNRKISSGDGLGNRCHLAQVSHHAVEGPAQFTDLVLTLDIDFVVQVPGGSNLLGDLHQVGQRFGNGPGGAEGDEAAQTQRGQRAQQGDADGPVAGGIITVAPLFQNALAFLICQIEIFSRILYPRARIFLQIENLQFGHGGISLVHLFALLHERFSEVAGPALFRLLYFCQRGPLLLGGGQGQRVLHAVNQGADAVIHMVGLAAVSAQQVVGQIEAVLHHLKSDLVGGIGQLEGLRRRRLGAVLAEYRCQVYREQHHNHDQHRAEAEIKFSADRHALPPLAAAALLDPDQTAPA